MTNFAETPEGREYLLALQNGSKGPPLGASTLEHVALKSFQERSKKAGAFISQRDRIVKEIAQAEEQVKALTRQGDIVSGEATAFAEILLIAEESRREEKKLVKNPDVTGGENGDPENEDRAPDGPRVRMAPLPNAEGEAVVEPIPNAKGDVTMQPLTTAAKPAKAEEVGA